MRRLPLLLAVAGLLTLAGCAADPSDAPAPAMPTTSDASDASGDDGDCAGVRVVVAFGPLDAAAVDDCVAADAPLAAHDALTAADVTTEGSTEWGDQIVCRVDGRPAPDETVTVAGEAPFTESCASMPPAYAYWALWVRDSADADWAYAQEGLGTLQLEPGQSVGLVWTTGTATPTPEG